MSVSRRQFVEALTLGGGMLASIPTEERASGILAGARASISTEPVSATQAVDATASHIGNLYEFVQKQADRSPLELSFLQSKFKSLKQWQPGARAKVFEHLFYAPPKVAPQAQLVRRTDRGDYVEEYLTFRTTPDLRIPVCVLIPKQAKFPAPGILALHSHDGMYLWGKEKIVENDREHPVLTAFKQRRYGGKSIAAELARQGYVVAVIDMLYWGERRMLLADDPPAYRERPMTMTEAEIGAFDQRASQNESLLGRSLLTAGVTWPGVLLWDDIRALDYLASRPEVDAKRLGCVGLSVGGYRSFLLAALDERIRVAVDVGWMTSFASQIKQHVDPHHRPVVPHHRAVSLSGSARSGCPDCAARRAGDQRVAGSAVRAQWGQGGLRKGRALLRQGGCAREPEVQPLRRAPRIQPGDAGRSLAMDQTLAVTRSPSMKANVLVAALAFSILAGWPGLTYDGTATALWLRGYAILPAPQKVALSGGDFPFGSDWQLQLGPGIAPSDQPVTTLQSGLRKTHGWDLTTARGGNPREEKILRLELRPGAAAAGTRPAIGRQAYLIELSPTRVTVTGNDRPGLFYGVQTFSATASLRRRGAGLAAGGAHRGLARAGTARDSLGHQASSGPARDDEGVPRPRLRVQDQRRRLGDRRQVRVSEAPGHRRAGRLQRRPGARAGRLRARAPHRDHPALAGALAHGLRAQAPRVRRPARRRQQQLHDLPVQRSILEAHLRHVRRDPGGNSGGQVLSRRHRRSVLRWPGQGVRLRGEGQRTAARAGYSSSSCSEPAGTSRSAAARSCSGEKIRWRRAIFQNFLPA